MNMKENASEMVKKLQHKERELSETNQILLNDNENMKRYITSLEKEINEKTIKINENDVEPLLPLAWRPVFYNRISLHFCDSETL